MSRLSKRFYIAKCELGLGPFGWEILTGAFLISRYPPHWLDIMQVVMHDGTCIEDPILLTVVTSRGRLS